ncbi:MAG: hypothetical protein ISQ46_05655 [Methylophilaceae bacterium]|nr:hypothetical protein [Methylophilaceae bacterium]
MSEIYSELIKKFEKYKNRFKNNKNVRITIDKEFVRLDYVNGKSRLFLNVESKRVNNIWIGWGDGIVINSKGDINMDRETMNLDDFREDNADYYKLGDYIKKIPNETN